MRKEAKDMLREAVIPMLLGDNARAQLLALKIYLRCGVTSYVCDTKRSLFSLINPAVSFFRLYSDSKDGIAVLEALGYVASNTDYLPMIVACDASFAELIDNNREFFEPRFILTDSVTLFSSSPLSKLV